jgi:hypothetical protein
MKMNLLNKTAVCLLAGAFLAGSVFAATTGSTTTGTTKKTSTPAKTTTAKTSPFDDPKDAKKDKTTAIPPAGWNGAITVTADASGKPTAATFTNDQDKTQYNVQIDDTAKKILAYIKTGSRVQIKGNSVLKADGKLFVKLTDCAALPDTPAPPAQ